MGKFQCKKLRMEIPIGNHNREQKTQTKPKYQPFTKWDAHIKQQPNWMQNLIKHVDFNRLTKVLTAVDESDHMIIVSDGSGKDFKMTYEWIMSTPRGDRVARCAIHSYGRESSLQAEATGMLFQCNKAW